MFVCFTFRRIFLCVCVCEEGSVFLLINHGKSFINLVSVLIIQVIKKTDIILF